MTTITKKKIGEKIDNGLYESTLTGIKDVGIVGDDDFGPSFEWTFEVAKPSVDGKPVEPMSISCLSSQRFSNHPKCKIGIIMNALGAKVEIGEEFTLESLLGKKCKLVIGERAKGDMVFSAIKDFMRF